MIAPPRRPAFAEGSPLVPHSVWCMVGERGPEVIVSVYDLKSHLVSTWSEAMDASTRAQEIAYEEQIARGRPSRKRSWRARLLAMLRRVV